MPEPLISERIEGGVRQPRRHDSAWKHVSGSATYIDDVTPPAGLLHVYLGISTHAHARIKHINLGAGAPGPRGRGGADRGRCARGSTT